MKLKNIGAKIISIGSTVLMPGDVMEVDKTVAKLPSIQAFIEHEFLALDDTEERIKEEAAKIAAENAAKKAEEESKAAEEAARKAAEEAAKKAADEAAKKAAAEHSAGDTGESAKPEGEGDKPDGEGKEEKPRKTRGANAEK